MGDKMDYSVALDTVPEKGKPTDGVMAKTWLKAAEENGIPTAFVVKDGKIAWIGHPMKLDEPLAKITAGDWDPTAHAKERLVAKTNQRKAALVRQKILQPYRAGDFKATLAAIEEATSGDADLAEQFAPVKFAAPLQMWRDRPGARARDENSRGQPGQGPRSQQHVLGGDPSQAEGCT